ncbi:MAG: acyl-CoA dehydrogenase family protein [Prolixibacteraceae bacterium]|jgi:alkylation response protein AidB-like acyl-CoA dehydrogenase|nr:acyl-CoA dehydrogenase family protein [Prolixibacteraceae bacterium]
MYPVAIAKEISFPDFLDSFKRALKSVFYERDQLEKFIQKRGFPALVLREIMAVNPLSVAIPEKYGGRGAKVKECLGMMDAAAYESLPLSLTFGINMALFLQPVAKYANELVKGDIFERFLKKQNMGGLMITEPDYGSDALNMQTSNEKIGSKYHIRGTKHWQGLTGLADYWLMASRPKNVKGELGRDIDFFICDVQQPGQQIQVEEYYNNIGLYPIPYGRNNIDIMVPEEFKLVPGSTGLKLMMDLLHRSRMQFPGMGMGFIRRMLDEALRHTNSRVVAGKPLMSLDQVQHYIARIQNAFTVSSAMCSRSAESSGIENDLAPATVEAASMKAFITDLMQESAQILTQLSGANGYREEHVAARGIIDSRPFMIFEGSNEMLYTQIADAALKQMARRKNTNLSVFLKNYELTEKAAGYFDRALGFSVDLKMSQRKMVDLGKIISRAVAAAHVVMLADKGFRNDLVNNSIETIKQDILMLVSSFRYRNQVVPVEEYHEQSSWMAFS